MAEAYIVAAVRTPGGRKGGRLASWHPADLAAYVLDAVIARSGIDSTLIEDVIMGCVSAVGEQSNNIARNAVISSSLPQNVPATSVDRQCGSSQQAIHFAAQAVMSGAMDVVIAAGVESMTRVPMGLSSALPAAHGFGTPTSAGMAKRYPGIVFDQFSGAEMIARKYGMQRESLDAFAYHSHRKAIAATQRGDFRHEIAPIVVLDAAGNSTQHEVDEGIRFNADLAAISQVKLLRADGVLTAASSSQICDGASAVLIVNEAGLKRTGAVPLARIHQMTVVGGDPVVMLESPIAATQLALRRAGLKIDDIDLYEINEAFASVPVAWMESLHADPDRLNVNGGAISLGHPLGASGTKLMATLTHALRSRGKRYGLQSMCEGGGMANATIVEAL